MNTLSKYPKGCIQKTVKTCPLFFQNLRHRVIDNWKEYSECIIEKNTLRAVDNETITQTVGGFLFIGSVQVENKQPSNRDALI